MRTIGGALACASPRSTTCWRKRRTLTNRPRGGCARPISHEPIAVTITPSASTRAMTRSVSIFNNSPPAKRGGEQSQRLAFEPARALRIERVQIRPFEARHVGFYLVADLALQISKMPVAFWETLEQVLIEGEFGRRIDGVEAVSFISESAQHQSPAAAAILEEIVEPPGADHVADDAVD